MTTIMHGVGECAEGYPVELDESTGRPCIVALNEGQMNSTSVDLWQLLEWLRSHRPDLLNSPPTPAKPLAESET